MGRALFKIPVARLGGGGVVDAVSVILVIKAPAV